MDAAVGATSNPLVDPPARMAGATSPPMSRTFVLANVPEGYMRIHHLPDAAGYRRSRLRRQTTVSAFVTSIARNQEDLLERMWNPKVEVQGNLASLWAPYDFHIGGRFSHRGTDALHLLRANGVDYCSLRRNRRRLVRPARRIPVSAGGTDGGS